MKPARRDGTVRGPEYLFRHGRPRALLKQVRHWEVVAKINHDHGDMFPSEGSARDDEIITPCFLQCNKTDKSIACISSRTISLSGARQLFTETLEALHLLHTCNHEQ